MPVPVCSVREAPANLSSQPVLAQFMLSRDVGSVKAAKEANGVFTEQWEYKNYEN